MRADDRYQAGLDHFCARRLGLAESSLRAAPAATPKSAPIRLDLGIELRARGHFVKAAQAFEQTIALAPDMVSAHLSLGSFASASTAMRPPNPSSAA